MKRKILQIIQLLIFTTMALVGTALVVSAQGNIPSGNTCTLTPGSQGITGGVFEITPWYKYLPGRNDNENQKCRPDFPQSNGKTDIAKTGTLIAVAVIELLTRVSGLIAAGFIIYGAIQYITSQGEPEGLANAKNTITNALIGFVIVMLAIAVVQFMGRVLK